MICTAPITLESRQPLACSFPRSTEKRSQVSVGSKAARRRRIAPRGLLWTKLPIRRQSLAQEQGIVYRVHQMSCRGDPIGGEGDSDPPKPVPVAKQQAIQLRESIYGLEFGKEYSRDCDAEIGPVVPVTLE